VDGAVAPYPRAAYPERHECGKDRNRREAKRDGLGRVADAQWGTCARSRVETISS
jgi:hypothetical protein